MSGGAAAGGAFVAPRLQRSLSAVYRFYDAFLFPPDERTPPLDVTLDVTIPALDWAALPWANDFTYRFSASTLTRPAPSGAGLAVEVTARNGDYINFEPILLTLPLAVSLPPLRSDFLIARALWPTPAARPPAGETVVRGTVRSATAQPVADLKVVMWSGGSVSPPAGTPYTRTNAAGDFLYRLPQLKGATGSAVSITIQVEDGAVTVAPATLPILLGQTQIVAFQRA
ncbi:MAG TPA: hypothetical protein VHY35_24755 [Stellaceae bacterium]|jgi:hypothetical protein|nr:hypothetical protein [Stellaceae bacterium]